jgi:hypothetical protein
MIQPGRQIMKKMAPGVERAGAGANCAENCDSHSKPKDGAWDLTIDNSPYQAHSLSFS